MRIIFGILTLVCCLTCNRNQFTQTKYQPEVYTTSSVVVPKPDTAIVPLPDKPAIYAIFLTTQGTMVLELFDKDAPKTVQNFIDLAQGEKEFLSRNGQKVKNLFMTV